MAPPPDLFDQVLLRDDDECSISDSRINRRRNINFFREPPPDLFPRLLLPDDDECPINESKTSRRGINFLRVLAPDLLTGSLSGEDDECSSNEAIMIERQHDPNIESRSSNPLDNPDELESRSEEEIPFHDDLEEAAHGEEKIPIDDDPEYLENRRDPMDDQQDRPGNPVTLLHVSVYFHIFADFWTSLH
jgi:hypothetical protein